jgi:hypothetical protein
MHEERPSTYARQGTEVGLLPALSWDLQLLDMAELRALDPTEINYEVVDLNTTK